VAVPAACGAAHLVKAGARTSVDFGHQAEIAIGFRIIVISAFGTKQTYCHAVVTSAFDPMYGPAVHRKRLSEMTRLGLALMYPASLWSLCSGP